MSLTRIETTSKRLFEVVECFCLKYLFQFKEKMQEKYTGNKEGKKGDFFFFFSSDIFSKTEFARLLQAK